MGGTERQLPGLVGRLRWVISVLGAGHTLLEQILITPHPVTSTPEANGGGLSGIGAPTPVPILALSDGVILSDPALRVGCLTREVICSWVHNEQGLSAVPRIRICDDETIEVDAQITEHYPGRGFFSQRSCKRS